jgi:hypothetical protein
LNTVHFDRLYKLKKQQARETRGRATKSKRGNQTTSSTQPETTPSTFLISRNHINLSIDSRRYSHNGLSTTDLNAGTRMSKTIHRQAVRVMRMRVTELRLILRGALILPSPRRSLPTTKLRRRVHVHAEQGKFSLAPLWIVVAV